MDERPKADLIERIRNLLKKTEAAGCTPAEAETAFKMASRFMAEHNLAMAEIEVKDGTSDDISWLEDDVIDTGRWSLEMNLAYGIVAEHCFVQGFFDHVWASGKHAKRLKFFGKAENVETAKFIFSSLLDAFDRLFIDYRRRPRCAASERRMFVTGVAHGFTQKMRDERRAMEMERDIVQGKGSGATALVLASVKDRTIKAYKDAHPGMKNQRTSFASTRGSQSSLDAGIAAGRSLSLNRALGGGSDRGNKGISSS